MSGMYRFHWYMFILLRSRNLSKVWFLDFPEIELLHGLLGCFSFLEILEIRKPKSRLKWSTFSLFFLFLQKGNSLSSDSRLTFWRRNPKSFLSINLQRQLWYWVQKVDVSKTSTCLTLLATFAQKCYTGSRFWRFAESANAEFKSTMDSRSEWTWTPRCVTCTWCRGKALLKHQLLTKSWLFKKVGETQSNWSFSGNSQKHCKLAIQMNTEMV